MKKSNAYLSFILGLIISFPIIFQSFHAIEHHILEDNYQLSCCTHHEETQQPNNNEPTTKLNTEIDLCPICEYQIVYFLDESPIIPHQDFVFLHELKTPILVPPVVLFRDCKNKLRGPPLS